MVFQEQNFHEKNMKSHCKCVILSITLFSSQVWLALLAACNKWGNEKVARSVFNQFREHMMKL